MAVVVVSPEYDFATQFVSNAIKNSLSGITPTVETCIVADRTGFQNEILRTGARMLIYGGHGQKCRLFLHNSLGRGGSPCERPADCYGSSCSSTCGKLTEDYSLLDSSNAKNLDLESVLSICCWSASRLPKELNVKLFVGFEGELVVGNDEDETPADMRDALSKYISTLVSTGLQIHEGRVSPSSGRSLILKEGWDLFASLEPASRPMFFMWMSQLKFFEKE